MKKFIFACTLFLIGLGAKANTATMSLHSMAPSTISAGFELQFLVSSMPSGSCYGNFTVAFERKLATASTWDPVTLTPVTSTPTTGISTFSKLYRIYQLEGLTYNYRVTVTFNPQTGGTGCDTAPNQSKTSAAVNGATPKACFTILNPSNYLIMGSYYGNQVVNEIGLSSGDVKLNATCSINAIGYHVRVSKFDLTNWVALDDLYNNWISSSINPASININSLIAGNSKSFEPNAIYLVNVSVGPAWHSANAKFFKIDFSGKAAPIGQIKGDEMLENPIIVSPNPVTDLLTIDLSQTKASKMTVYDLSGKLIDSYTPSTNESKVEMNFSNYTSGTYLLQMQTETGIQTEKIIKK